MIAARLIPVTVLAIIALWPAGAIAQSDLRSPLPPAAPVSPAVPTPTSAPARASSGGSLEGWQQTLLFAAGAALLGGIAWVIVRDARRAAPITDHRPSRSASSRSEDRARARARSKAARRQRKRNR